MDKNNEISKQERVDNSDGSYITKEVYEDGTSCIRYWDKNENNLRCEFYSDDNFKNLEMTSQNKFKMDGSYVAKQVYNNPTSDGYQSIIGWYDSQKRNIKTKEFFDNNFKILMNYSVSKYDKAGSCLVLIHRYMDDEYYKIHYNENGKLVEIFFYQDKKFKNLFSTHKRIYNNDNSFKQEIFFELERENGCKYGIMYSDSNNLWQSSQFFSDESCNEIITDTKIEYNEDYSYIEKSKFYKGTRATGMYKEKRIIHSEITNYNRNCKIIRINDYSDLDFKELLHKHNIEYLKNRWEKHTIIFSKPQLEDDGQICEIQIKRNKYQYQNIKKYADIECKNLISETVFIYNDNDSYIAKTIYFNKSKNNKIDIYGAAEIIIQSIEYSDDDFKCPIEKRTFVYYHDNKKSKDVIIEHIKEHYSELKEYDTKGELLQTKKCNFTGLLTFLIFYPHIRSNILLPIVVGSALVPVYLNHMPSFFVIVHTLYFIFCIIFMILQFKEFYQYYK
ncbi:MAG: hypothetical protein ACI37Q_05920 [Candidatus Gastranaerophilaceae bacterium]